MKKSTLLFALCIVTGFTACKKDSSSTKEQYSKLIIGTWKSSQQNTKIFDLNTNELLKDSTVIFEGELSGRSWSEVYSTNGNTYTVTLSRKLGTSTLTADTTAYAGYNILGTNLTLKQSIGGTQTKPILVLNLTDMALQYAYTGTLNAGWSLNAGQTYKIVQDTHYTRK